MKNKRIDLKLSARNAAHRRAMTKLELYDKNLYASMTDYIVCAIEAYEEPMEVTKSELRRVIREELKGVSSAVRDAGNGRIPARQPVKEPPLAETEPGVLEERADQDSPQLDPATLDFMKELGI